MRKLPKEIVYVDGGHGEMKPATQVRKENILKQEKKKNLIQSLLWIGIPILLPLLIIGMELIKRIQ